ncbi:hypothetical protein [Flavobacterium sp.]|uniref:hypothetical protein n=1 Tax=Flavobacterium sp. TaxID=239 RepID=UPI003751F47E
MTAKKLDIDSIIIVEDAHFIKFVKEEIQTLKNERNSRKDAPAGMKYKTDWFDRLQRENALNSDYFIKNIEAIWLKQSNLPALIRNIIQSVCYKAFTKMNLEYKKK